MESLFKHLISHCDDYEIETFELIQSDDVSRGGFVTTLYDVSLIIKMSSLGNIISPELSRIQQDTCDQYNVIILAIPKPQTSDHTQPRITLTIYLILVNKFETYPRLTVHSPDTVSSHVNRSIEDDDDRQSQLNLSVRNHRRKLGYGSLNTPSSSEVVINNFIIHEELKAAKVNLMYSWLISFCIESF